METGQEGRGARRTRRRALRGIVLGAVAVTATVLAACGSSSSDSAGADRFRLGTAQAAETLNPLAGTTAAAASIANLTLPTLSQWNEDWSEVVGDFAKSWTISDDRKTITFETHTGKWSDGEPLTAEDAAWTINTFVKYQDGPTASRSDAVVGIERAEATDEDTLVVTYENLPAEPFALLQRATILPRHIWEEHVGDDGAGLVTYAPDADDVVTGGPFTVRRFESDGSLVLLERAEGYYGEPPTVNVLGFQVYSSPDALIAALKNGDIDGIELLPPNAPFESLEETEQIGRGPGRAVDWLILNSNKDKPKHRELLDQRVREALDVAIDREAIVETALRGHGEAGAAWLPSSNAFHDDAIPVPAFDLDRANQLLDGAGYERGSDGVRVADGERMEYTVLSAPTASARAFQIVRDGWEKIGVRVSRRQLDAPALVAAMTEPDGEGLAYDIVQWGYNVSADPQSALRLAICGGFGLDYWCNEEYDRLYGEQVFAPDVDARRELINEMQQLLAEERPYLVLNYQDAVSALAPGWKAPPMTPSGYFQPLTSKLALTNLEHE